MVPALQSPGYVFTLPNDGRLAIPEDAIHLLPPPNATVRHIIGFDFPPASLETTPSTHLRLSRNEPTEPVLDVLMKQNTPSEYVLNQLKAGLSKGRGGTRSIAYSIANRKSSACQYYPLWVLTWWELAYLQTNKQQLWICADNWLASKLQTSDHTVAQQMLSSARELLSYLPWDVEIPRDKEYSSADLAYYISDRWLASRHIEWMLDRVKERLPADEPIILYPPNWIEQVASRFEGKNAPAGVVARFLKKLQDSVARGTRPRVYTVANYDEVHWITLEIDFQKHTIAYGDSQGGSYSSARFLNILKSWLGQTWPEEWNHFTTKELPHGDQSDDTSCGICAVNTIEARVFGYQLWNQELHAAYRASKFIEMAHYVIETRNQSEVIPKAVYIEDLLKTNSTRSIWWRISLEHIVSFGLCLAVSYALQKRVSPCMPGVLNKLACIIGYQRRASSVFPASFFDLAQSFRELRYNVGRCITEVLVEANRFNPFR